MRIQKRAADCREHRWAPVGNRDREQAWAVDDTHGKRHPELHEFAAAMLPAPAELETPLEVK
ncbi:MAG TPA: hypothetical protein EYP98_14445 [Planctomycetes bacterium]|nr:hypothetical protein [Planctomycetota bacterium]